MGTILTILTILSLASRLSAHVKVAACPHGRDGADLMVYGVWYMVYTACAYICMCVCVCVCVCVRV